MQSFGTIRGERRRRVAFGDGFPARPRLGLCTLRRPLLRGIALRGIAGFPGRHGGRGAVCQPQRRAPVSRPRTAARGGLGGLRRRRALRRGTAGHGTLCRARRARRAGRAARRDGRDVQRSCGASRSCATPLRTLAECTLSCALRQAPFVTQSQPAGAVGDAATVIPAHLTRPAHWTRRGIRGGAARPFGRGRVGEVEWVSRVGEVERVRSVSRSGRLPGDRAGRVDHALAGEGVARLRARAGARPAGARHVARLP